MTLKIRDQKCSGNVSDKTLQDYVDEYDMAVLEDMVFLCRYDLDFLELVFLREVDGELYAVCISLSDSAGSIDSDLGIYTVVRELKEINFK